VARSDSEPQVLPSVLDRLLDSEPRLTRDRDLSWDEGVERFRQGLLRDLEWMLNTRRTQHAAGAAHPEVRDSAYNFGLPDITSMSGDDPGARQALLSEVQEVLKVFEPRLEATRVVLRTDDAGSGRQVRFTIEGMLRLDPSPERVAFDTVLEVGSGQFRVREEGGGA
jgi:type VI secretion system protein ImpF